MERTLRSAKGAARPVWLGPAAALVAAVALAGGALHLATGGREVADDAPRWIRLVQHPLALFGDYEAIDVSVNYASYPPLQPLVYGALVRPWLALASPFWAVRLGALCWSLLLLASVPLVARAAGAAADAERRAVWSLALLPSVWGAAALIPQEEAYVALFAVALYLAAARGRSGLLAPLFLLTALAGKHALLAMALPLAARAPRPLRALATWLGPSAAALAAFVGYHALRYDHPLPILAHSIDPQGTLSLWAVPWLLGARPDPGSLGLASIAMTAAAVLALALAARRGGPDLAGLVAVTLLVVLLLLWTTVPGHVLWVLPFAALGVARLQRPAARGTGLAALVLWGVGEWGANFVRGAALARDAALTQQRESGAGKAALAALAERWLGEGFPYHAMHVALVLLVLGSGVVLAVLSWFGAPRREDGARSP
jgi:hypothetical protein